MRFLGLFTEDAGDLGKELVSIIMNLNRALYSMIRSCKKMAKKGDLSFDAEYEGKSTARQLLESLTKESGSGMTLTGLGLWRGIPEYRCPWLTRGIFEAECSY